MKMKTLQSLASRNRNTIAYLEGLYTINISYGRQQTEKDAKDFHYNEARVIRKEIAKLADIQKDLKRSIHEEVKYQRDLAWLSDVFDINIQGEQQ